MGARRVHVLPRHRRPRRSRPSSTRRCSRRWRCSAEFERARSTAELQEGRDSAHLTPHHRLHGVAVGCELAGPRRLVRSMLPVAERLEAERRDPLRPELPHAVLCAAAHASRATTRKAAGSRAAAGDRRGWRGTGAFGGRASGSRSPRGDLATSRRCSTGGPGPGADVVSPLGPQHALRRRSRLGRRGERAGGVHRSSRPRAHAAAVRSARSRHRAEGRPRS